MPSPVRKSTSNAASYHGGYASLPLNRRSRKRLIPFVFILEQLAIKHYELQNFEAKKISVSAVV